MPDADVLLVGLMAGAVGASAAFVLPRRAVGPVEQAMLALVLFGWLTDRSPVELAMAVLAVIAGSHLPGRWGPLRWIGVAGAAVIVAAEVPQSVDDLVPVAAAAVLVVLVVAGRCCRRAVGGGAAVASFGWVSVAAYLAVPDTEEVTMVGAAIVVVAASMVVGRLDVNVGGLDAVVVVTVWAIALGGRGREASYVVMAAVALPLVLGPALVALRRTIRWSRPAAWLLVAIHVGAGVVVARWAGLGHDWATNGSRAGVVGALSVVAAAPVAWLASARWSELERT